MSNQKKQSFLGGAASLTAAVVAVKLIGAVYKIPLNNILGGVGKTYFDTAYQIYNFLLTFCTAGLSIAISKLTSQSHAQGRENEKRKIFRTAIWLFFLLGIVGTALMFFGAQQLANFQENTMAAQAIRVESSNGAISLDSLESPDIQLQNQIGAITGSIQGKKADYRIVTEQKLGENNLTEQSGGTKQLQVKTNLGRIHVTFNE